MRKPILQRLRELGAKIDLGEGPIGDSLCSPVGKISEKWYPRLYISGRSEEIELPKSGKAVIDYRVTSRTTNIRDGEERHSVDIEVRSIEAVDETEGTYGTNRTDGRARKLKISEMGAGGRGLRAGMIAFERTRDGNGQFAPEGTGTGPNDMAAAYGEPALRPGMLLQGAGTGAAAALGGAAAAGAARGLRKGLGALRKARGG